MPTEPVRPSRRRMLLSLSALPAGGAALAQTAQEKVERWGIFEAAVQGPSSGNPFQEVRVRAEFRHGHRTVQVDGFYDGEGVYRIRFSPDTLGDWSYVTRSNRPELNGKPGAFTCVAPTPGNRGPVGVQHTWHFSYADGTPYFPVGTTCYAWAHQGDQLEEQTLATLRAGPFNKMRMCVFPKDYVYNQNEPQFYPFPRQGGRNDYTRFDPAFFRHFEKRVGQLMAMGIEADLILFHPYDRWGYHLMPAEVDDAYLRYLVARLAAYRNVWWSMANEWDFVKEKKVSDWDRYFHIVQESDPYQRLRSIHNGSVLYDHAKPWVTHASIQGDDFSKTVEWRNAYRKPVIFDECKYEGNIPRRWGNISGHEMVRRLWLATANGAYGGHGETFLDAKDVLWWSKGGVLHGESPRRLAFLRRILEEGPAQGINPLPNQKYAVAAREDEYYLFYYDLSQPGEMDYDLPAGVSFRAEIIDPWQMTITAVPGTHQGKFVLRLPGRPHLAVRFRKA